MICSLLQCRYISGHLCIPFNARQILSAGDEYYFVKQGKKTALRYCIMFRITFLRPDYLENFSPASETNPLKINVVPRSTGNTNNGTEN